MDIISNNDFAEFESTVIYLKQTEPELQSNQAAKQNIEKAIEAVKKEDSIESKIEESEDIALLNLEPEFDPNAFVYFQGTEPVVSYDSSYLGNLKLPEFYSFGESSKEKQELVNNEAPLLDNREIEYVISVKKMNNLLTGASDVTQMIDIKPDTREKFDIIRRLSMCAALFIVKYDLN